ncbi:hypothetical protein V1525DRAFT_433953 [Lipomyces kononenkoae]|uniref:Uncharacterized protein n=1 Tax=Lipomyces kononenkoae TaxID=34357 RepID=A0ACC3SYI5_LIPKO
MSDRPNLEDDCARLRSGASGGHEMSGQTRLDSNSAAANAENTVDDAFAIYSYYISITDHLPSDIKRSLNLITSLAHKYTVQANDLESLVDAINNDQYSTINETISRIKDANTESILRDRKESLREALRMLQVLRRHYKKLDIEITKMEKAAQAHITSTTGPTVPSKDTIEVSPALPAHDQSPYMKKRGRTGKPISDAQLAHAHTLSLRSVKISQPPEAPRRQLRNSAMKATRPEQQEASLTRTRRVQPVLPPPAISTGERLRESKQSPAALRESSLNIRHLRRHQPEKPVPEYRASPRREYRSLPRRSEDTGRLISEAPRALRVSTELARDVGIKKPSAVQKISVARAHNNDRHGIIVPNKASRTPGRPLPMSAGPKRNKDIRRAVIQELYNKKREHQDSLKRKAKEEAEEKDIAKRRNVSQKTYCICNDVSYGDMIACDDKKCKIEWYHLGCVNMKRPPKGEWICPLCLERRKHQLKRGGRRG